ncbi:S-layer homology domain-containing protein [Aneurinibacillus sp. Ricciae_BoGa-3]|uniref:S-layer homology domain-containing protein n=1 Tax=Aneurinibacillus sp. Ricciae_BoGa-3 TaxID=3022697 RepID=UPI002340E539|nr:S-layer homology domain-containing protein [Aneurinibacillus sp. Ricciae_BoGa-3]WCK54303.1 S-layer homology domain-containing protein [Aneurinibacillus sp. Ricciae_BoGa-3]
MKRVKRSIIPFTFAGLMSVTSLGWTTTAFGAVNFSDVPDNHWASQYITKMGLRGVASGYEDGTFHPNFTVTQAEALSLAMRNMGLKSAAESYKGTSGKSYNAPAWAKGYIGLAIDKGLIKPTENRFTPGQPATRAWVAQLMVRMINKDSEAAANTGASNFLDSSSIPSWASRYVKTAVDYGILSGYADNGGYVFKPNQAITRAEMLTLLSNGEKYLDIESNQTQVGTLQAINHTALAIKSSNNNTVHTYAITDQTIFYDHKKKVTVDDIKPASEAIVIGDGTNASYVELTGDTGNSAGTGGAGNTGSNGDTSSANTVMKVTVEKVYPEANTLIVKDDNSKLTTYAVDSQVKLNGNGGTLTNISQLMSGDVIQATVSPDGKIIEIARTGESQASPLQGTVYDVDASSKLITIKSASGKLAAYQYSDSTTVDYKNHRFPTVGDLKQGDSVKLVVDGQNIVSSITLQAAQDAPGVTGTVKTILPDQNFITVQKDDGTLQAYKVDPNVTVTLNGTSSAAISDVQSGDQISLTADNGTVTAIAVTNRTSTDQPGMINGTVYAVDQTNRIVSLKMASGDLKAYELAATAPQIVVNGITNPALSDLKKDMNVSVQLDSDNKIIYINADNRVKAQISRIDMDNRLLTVKLTTGELKVYIVSNNVTIVAHDLRTIDIGDLRVGDNVSMTLSGSQVGKIEVERAIVYRITNVNTSVNLLTGQDDAGNIRNFDLSSGITFTAPGNPYPKASDVKVGDVIKGTYLGDTLKSIALLPSITGTVVSVDTDNNKFSVRDYNGVLTDVPFNTGSIINSGDLQYASLNALHKGDRVQVADATNNTKTVSVMKAIQTTFTSLDPLGDRVYTTVGSYYLPQSLFNRLPNLDTTLRGINKNDKIVIYQFNNEVYDISTGN